MSEKVTIRVSASTAHELNEYIDSHMMELENSFSSDADMLEKFRANEVPFVIDILSDFGKFPADLQAGFNAIPNFNDQVIATNNFIAVVAECYVYARQKDFEMPYLG